MLLISKDYQDLNAQCHAENKGWGKGGMKFLDDIVEMVKLAGHESVLDYGCGKGDLVCALNFQGILTEGYDPGVRDYRYPPHQFHYDLVICTDVVEHVEPELLDNVLANISTFTRDEAFIVAGLTKAVKHLPDGRNAHLTVENAFWWKEKLAEHFPAEVVCTRESRTTAVFKCYRGD